MKKIIIYLMPFIAVSLNSQCLTDHIQKEAEKNNPAIIQEKQQFYSNLQEISNKRATKYIVPVVFHVIHTNGSENISFEQIQNQIDLLNKDFSLTNPDKTKIRSAFISLAADCEIEFRLAKIDPSGNCTNGVNRIYSPLHVDARDNVKSIPGARWDYKKYLNIWVVSSILDQSGSGGTTLGYAYLPSSVPFGNTGNDGIVIRSDYVGAIGTGSTTGAGRTLTHEVGHYLGLLHTFQDGCSGSGDYCDDTPPVLSTFTNANCPGSGNSCSTDVPNLIDQWENYMDYSRGECQEMFTPDQKTIMHNTFTSYSFRSNLVSNNNLIATGVVDGGSAPKAFFTSSTRTVCVGEPVKFFDASCKSQVSSRQWQFEGANVFVTNKDTPSIIYSTPGKYKVTLMATNSSGSNTLAVDNYIEVLPNVAALKPTFKETIEHSDWDIQSGMKVLDPSNIKFRRVNNVGYYSKYSLKAPCDSGALGQRFQLSLPQIDLRPLKGKGPKISMMIGYLRESGSSGERLRLYYSKGCGSNWTQIVQRTAGTIAYNTSFQDNFVPSDPSHWKLFSFGLSSYENDSNIQFMVEIEGAQGNAVYIDDINIGQFNTDVTQIEKQINLAVYPNPSEGEINIQYENNLGNTSVWLETVDGKKINEISSENVETGLITINWNGGAELNSGVYLLKIKANNQIITKKLIFAK